MSETDETTLYCGGLPLASERLLSDEERRVLSHTARRLRSRGWLISLVLLVGLLPAIATFTVLLETRWRDVVAVVGFALLLLGLPALILTARDDFRIARSIRSGLRTGRVQRFGTEERSVADGALDESCGEISDEENDVDNDVPGSSLEILADSGLMWRISDRPPRTWSLLQTTSVPNPPTYAATAAEWAQPWTDPEGETTWWNHRDLSAAELGELRKHVRRTIWPYVWLPLMTAYVCVGLFTGEWRDYPWTYWPLVVIFILADWKAVRMFPKVLLVRRDARLGKVVIFRPGMASDGPDAGDTGSPLGPATEFLPFSRLPWTHDGQPAPWRKAARR